MNLQSKCPVFLQNSFCSVVQNALSVVVLRFSTPRTKPLEYSALFRGINRTDSVQSRPVGRRALSYINYYHCPTPAAAKCEAYCGECRVFAARTDRETGDPPGVDSHAQRQHSIILRGSTVTYWL